MRRFKQVGDLLRALLVERRLSRHDRGTRDELAQHQRRRLAGLMRYARARSPFYRELYAGCAQGEEVDLRALPVTDKRLIMGNFDAVVTDPRLKFDALRRHLESIRRDGYHHADHHAGIIELLAGRPPSAGQRGWADPRRSPGR